MRAISRRVLLIFIVFFICVGSHAFASDSTFIKVQFIYGSKPLKMYRSTEKKWFGGLPGGHVGIETDSDQVLDFHHFKSFHVFATKDNRHSRFLMKPVDEFWSCFGTPGEEVKKGTVIIPVSRAQKARFDSIAGNYLSNTPYDYALIGMRCAAASYDILSQLGIVEKYPRNKMCMKIFYPKKLREKLYAMAKENGWAVIRQEGTTKRKWEGD